MKIFKAKVQKAKFDFFSFPQRQLALTYRFNSLSQIN